MPFYEKICSDNCGSAGDDDDDNSNGDDNNGDDNSPEGNVCYFDCKYLTLDHDGTQLGQVGNCGYDCTSGIAADIKGVVHPELYLWKTGYIENHGQYSYDTGPLNVQGINKNMFNRCYNECYNLP